MSSRSERKERPCDARCDAPYDAPRMHRVMQVWKKTLQPSPQISVCGGGVNQGVGVPHTARVELEVHACLLHVATGQLVPEALLGHLKPLEGSSLGDEKQLAFNELTVRSRQITARTSSPTPTPTPNLSPKSSPSPDPDDPDSDPDPPTPTLTPTPTPTPTLPPTYSPAYLPGDHQAAVTLQAAWARAARGRQPLPSTLFDLEQLDALVRDVAAHADLSRRAQLLPHAASRREELEAPAVLPRAQRGGGRRRRRISRRPDHLEPQRAAVAARGRTQRAAAAATERRALRRRALGATRHVRPASAAAVDPGGGALPQRDLHLHLRLQLISRRRGAVEPQRLP